MPRTKIDLGRVEIFDAADVTPHETGPDAPRSHPGGAQIVPNIRGRIATRGPPFASAVYLARPSQLLLVPGGGDREDVTEAEPPPAAHSYDTKREVIAGGEVVTLHFLDGQVVQQGHKVAAAVDIGPQPQVPAPPASDLGALRDVAVQTFSQDELRRQGADTFPDLDRIVVHADVETLDKARGPNQAKGVGIRFFRRQVRVAALQEVILGSR